MAFLSNNFIADSSFSNSKTLFFPCTNGENFLINSCSFSVDLNNCVLPVENNMQLGILGTDNDMFRNSSGAVFPYNINDIVSITGTNAPIEYYIFYRYTVI